MEFSTIYLHIQQKYPTSATVPPSRIRETPHYKSSSEIQMLTLSWLCLFPSLCHPEKRILGCLITTLSITVNVLNAGMIFVKFM